MYTSLFYHYFPFPFFHASTERLLCPVLIYTLNLLNALWLHIAECGDLKGTIAFACYGVPVLIPL